MKSLTEYLWFEVPGRRGFINITPKIEELVSQSGVREGLCLVNAMHITASVFINDDESGLHHDYEVWLEKLAPHAPTNAYQHNRTGKDNADAHLKRQIMGREVVVAITKGKLDLACPAVAPAKEEPLGTNLLRRIRRPPPQTRLGENYRRVEGLERGGIISSNPGSPSSAATTDLRCARLVSRLVRSPLSFQMFPVHGRCGCGAGQPIDKFSELAAEPMRTRAPPRLGAGIRNDVTHGRLEPAPDSRVEMALELLVVHVFVNPKEMIHEGTKRGRSAPWIDAKSCIPR